MEFLTTYFVSILRYCIEAPGLLARVGSGQHNEINVAGECVSTK